MLNIAIENLKGLLPELGTEELARLADIAEGRFTVYIAQSFLVVYRTTPELGEAVEAVVEAMEPYEALLRLEHDANTARTIPNAGDPVATKAALYAAIDAISLDQLREYGEYRKGAAK